MTSSAPFSCYVIGATTLPIHCAELLLKAGHDLRGVITADAGFADWAAAKGVPVLRPDDDLEARLGERPFDHLFSIVNEHILPEAVLAMPRGLAINYHDGPLPRYGGTHATSWALLHRERTHGITWHVAAKMVDAGDVLIQRHFEPAPDETAFSLNTRCYEAAIAAFGELVESLATGRATLTAQDLQQRTFFGKYKRPPGGALITWDRPADEIAALVRALDFGPHPNPLGCARLAVGDELVLVHELVVEPAGSGQAPGTIVATSPGLVVATASQDVALTRLSTVAGRPLPVSELVAQARLAPHAVLAPPAGLAEALAEATKATTRHEAAWVARLTGLEPPPIPFATTRAAGERGRRHLRLDASLAPESLRALATLPGASCAGELVLATAAAYLARLAGTPRLDLGFSEPELRARVAGLRGAFAEEVPLRCALDEGAPLPDAVARVLARLVEARASGTYARDVVLRYPPLRAAGAAGLALPIRLELADDAALAEAPAALAASAELIVRVARDGTRLVWWHDPEVYAAADVQRMAEQLACFLDGFVREPACELRYLPLLSAAERRRVVVEWNATGLTYPKDQPVHHVVEAIAARQPEALAVACGDERVSYAELNRRANRLAHHLRAQGVGPGTLVALCVERSAELVVAVLGITKAGAAYLPLDPTYPEQRLSYVIEDARCPVLVTERQLLARLGAPPARVVCLGAADSPIDREPDTDPAPIAGTRDLAYVIYTSGSTGRPKGVQIEHAGLLNLCFWHHHAFAITAADRATQLAGTGFDAAVWEIWPYLTAGASVHIPSDEVRSSPAELVAWLARTGITVTFIPTPIAEHMFALPWPAEHRLRLLLTGGDKLNIYPPPDLPVRIINNYGPTECTVVTTSGPVPTTPRNRPPDIGRPIANMRTYVLDRHRQPVPFGVPGELYIGGDGLARGYLGRDELTAEKFVENPLPEEPGARLYRTGDLVCHSPEGNIEFLGRLDNQVKVRGFRIELGEIDFAIGQFPDVKECAVVPREDEPGARRLVAYVVAQPGATVDFKRLREHLKERLPAYMVPAAFVPLGRLPLTSHGKVDRQALPAPDPAQADARESFVGPRDAVEDKLVAIWREVLKLPQVGVRDDYFALGGDSLGAVVLFAQIEDVFGKKLGLATLFQAPTIERLAGLLRGERSAPDWSPLVPIQPKGEKPPFFCIHARGGNVLFYRDLARRLGDDQPFYGIQPQGLDGKLPYLTRIEDMAALYIRELKKVQPRGPYYLGGSSFGGTAAFEMAQQLIAAGDEVAVLAVFDTGGPGYPKKLPVDRVTRLGQSVQALGRRVSTQLWTLRTLEPEQRLEYVQAKARKVEVKYKRKLRMNLIKLAKRLPAGLGARFLPTYVNARWALLEFEKAIQQALDSYVHEVYPGKMLLFRATKQPLGIVPDPTLGWGELVTGELEIHDVEGTHGSIVVEPSVRFLATKLAACMEQARQAHAAGAPRQRAVG